MHDFSSKRTCKSHNKSTMSLREPGEQTSVKVDTHLGTSPVAANPSVATMGMSQEENCRCSLSTLYARATCLLECANPKGATLWCVHIHHE